MKTAVQELFSKLETEYPSLFNTHSVDGRNFINNYHQFLELEKQQIRQAYHRGLADHLQVYPSTGYDSEKYYNKTFKNE